MIKKFKIKYIIICIVIIIFPLSLILNIYRSDYPSRLLNFLKRNNINIPDINEGKVISSNYYAFKLNKIFPTNSEFKLLSLKSWVTPNYQSFSQYGGLELLGNSILYVDGDGKSLIIINDEVRYGQIFDIPNHKDDFLKFVKNNYIGNIFGIKDILLVPQINENNDIYVSTVDFNPDKQCYFLSVYLNSINTNYKLISEKWTNIIETKPCLQKHKNGEFHGRSAGGKLAKSENGDVYLSIGDFYFDGVNEKNILQKSESDYGKILRLSKDGKAPVVLALGLRNPQGLYFSGNVLYESEHGPQGGDELNVINLNKSLVDYGWPTATFGVDYGKSQWPLDTENSNHINNGYVLPIFSWIPSIGISNLLVIQNSAKLKKWSNNVLVSSLRDQSLYRMALNEQKKVFLMERINVGFRVRDFIQLGNDFYLLEDNIRPQIWKLSIEEAISR
jgi:hypothetical protein